MPTVSTAMPADDSETRCDRKRQKRHQYSDRHRAEKHGHRYADGARGKVEHKGCGSTADTGAAALRALQDTVDRLEHRMRNLALGGLLRRLARIVIFFLLHLGRSLVRWQVNGGARQWTLMIEGASAVRTAKQLLILRFFAPASGHNTMECLCEDRAHGKQGRFCSSLIFSDYANQYPPNAHSLHCAHAGASRGLVSRHHGLLPRLTRHTRLTVAHPIVASLSGSANLKTGVCET